MVKEVNQKEFLNEIKEGVTVVDFFAQWCGPCKMITPVLDSIAEEMNSEVNFIKADVDECDEIADKYEAEHPNISIEIISPPLENSDTKITQMLMNGSGCDIV